LTVIPKPRSAVVCPWVKLVSEPVNATFSS
jgi:hypothetical protein